MSVEWMGRYRRLVSAIVVQGNENSKQLNLKREISEGLWLTSLEWQILEYTVEHRSDSSNMISISDKLGIPQSSFSKIVKTLCELELIEKYQSITNKKNIILQPTEYAVKVYEENSRRMYDSIFGGFFRELDELDDKTIEKFTLAMETLQNAFIEDIKKNSQEPVLIKLDR